MVDDKKEKQNIVLEEFKKRQLIGKEKQKKILEECVTKKFN